VGAEREEIERIYRRRYVEFRNGVLTVTGSLEAARDAVQEGFAQALRDRAQFRGDGALDAWIWRIVFRCALNARRNGHELTLDEAIVDTPLVPGERDPRLAEALHALPRRRRLVVFLRYFADLSYTEIAAICGVSEGTVAATLAQAHAQLSAALEAKEAHDG
jgi:RNA polymerase sigma-70 factor, ECF subfamily